jgi:replication factor C subunit 1
VLDTEQNIDIWINKYKPKKLNEMIGNYDEKIKFKKWLNGFDKSPNHTAIITGGHGIGKNLLARLTLIEAGYVIKNIYSTSLKNKCIISELVQQCSKNKNVLSFNDSSNSGNKKCAVIIDDTECITLSSEKDNLLELFKLNAEHKFFPLVLICNLQHSKLIDILKKTSLNINLMAPPVNQIKNYIISICDKEKMKFTDDKIYYSIIRFCQSDIRRLVFVLQDMYYTFNNSPITYEMFKQYQMMSQKKDIDAGLYYAARKLLDEYKNINECLQLYETEKVLLPLMIYENYYKKIFKQNLPVDDILKVMSNVTNSVSIGDVIETNIYSDQNWFLQNIHGFYTCADTSYNVNMANKQNNKNIEYNMIFSADLNKTSSRNINRKKNILPLQSKFKNKNIEDILFVNKIINELDKLKMNQTIKQIKNIYDLDSKNVQIALKIDKTNDKINKVNDKKIKLNNDVQDDDQNENNDDSEII